MYYYNSADTSMIYTIIVKRQEIPHMSTPHENLPPISLLCVDDDVNVLDVLKKYFEQKPDFSVFTCTTPSEALRLISQYQFDAIISDYAMPEMDGITFLKGDPCPERPGPLHYLYRPPPCPGSH